jgi:hypothetical protein
MFLRSKRALLLLMILPLVVGCAIGSGGNQGPVAPQSPCDKSSSIKGSIQTISTSSGTTIMLLDGTKEQGATYDKVSVLINSTTQIFEKHGQECQTVTLSALQTGQRVQIQASSPATQSYPPQITATEVLLLPKIG